MIADERSSTVENTVTVMTLDEAREFIASVPWRAVRQEPVGVQAAAIKN